jgi:hypothetical protein
MALCLETSSLTHVCIIGYGNELLLGSEYNFSFKEELLLCNQSLQCVFNFFVCFHVSAVHW